jgi:hypothetical protein
MAGEGEVKNTRGSPPVVEDRDRAKNRIYFCCIMCYKKTISLSWLGETRRRMEGDIGRQ